MTAVFCDSHCRCACSAPNCFKRIRFSFVSFVLFVDNGFCLYAVFDRYPDVV